MDEDNDIVAESEDRLKIKVEVNVESRAYF
jgi:hypothetical protein